jgi:hypothetical protein
MGHKSMETHRLDDRNLMPALLKLLNDKHYLAPARTLFVPRQLPPGRAGKQSKPHLGKIGILAAFIRRLPGASTF